MSCYHPMRAIRFPYKNPKTGKNVLKVIGKNFNVSEALKLSHLPPDCEEIEVPCGKCVGCRLQHSREWADRCTLEAMSSTDNQFITLTYDTPHLTFKDVVDVDTGEIIKWPTLNFDDLQKFLKRLRRYYEYHYGITAQFRYYACGEYGSTGGRPHFHIIVFNLPIYDKEYFFTNSSGDKIYLSDTIQKIWNKGQVSIGEATWQSVAYTARYVMKKQKGETRGCVELPGGHLVDGLIPEDTRMSRKPGIGYKYYDEKHNKFYDTDEIVISVRGKARTIQPCHYYDRLYDLESPEAMQAIKARRKLSAENAMNIALKNTSLSKEEYLCVKERDKLFQLSALKRGLKEL